MPVSTVPQQPSKLGSVVSLILSLAICFAAAGIGGVFTSVGLAG